MSTHLNLHACWISKTIFLTFESVCVSSKFNNILYPHTAGPDVDANMQFALISSQDADPPVFTLSFNSSNGPPTVVECTRDSQALDTSLYTVSREVLQTQYVQNGDVGSVNASEPDMPDVTRVTVTVTVRGGLSV